MLRLRPGLPHGIKAENILQMDGIAVAGGKDINFLLRQKKVGEWSNFIVRKNGSLEEVKARIVPFYGIVPFPLIYLFIGLMTFAIGLTCYIFKPQDTRARLGYWLALAFSSTLILGGWYRFVREDWLSYVPIIGFFLLDSLTAAFFLHFVLTFSPRPHRLLKTTVYSSAVLFSIVIIISLLWSLLASSIEIYRSYYVRTHTAFRVYVLALMLVSLIYLISIYRSTRLEEKREPIKWVFLGLFFSLAPYSVLYHIPKIFLINPLLSEELASLFFIFIPAAFALSIFKFKLIRVELVINRSVVYSLMTIFTVGFYLIFVQIFHRFLTRFFLIQEAVVSATGVLLVAAAFHPALKKVQELVDHIFFRQSYDYRKCIAGFNEDSQKIIQKDALADFFMSRVSNIMPLEMIGICVSSSEAGGVNTYISKGKADGFGEMKFQVGNSEMISARRRSVTTAENLDFTEERFLEENNMELLIPLSFKSTSLRGYLCLGRKKSGQRFTRDDIELLKTLAGELSLNLERIRLHEEVIDERASKEKLDELNRLKTEFISTVSHELSTPMSSIQGISEILGAGKVKERSKREELLNLIACESSRLSRLLRNILDFGKIEQGAETFHLERAEVISVIEEAAEIFRSQLEVQGFKLRIETPDEPVYLDIDRDAVKQVLINLIDNAMKYSLEKKEIDILLIAEKGKVEIRVKDKGIGIPEEELEKVFEKFHRVPQGIQLNPKGVGLGLKLVRCIMKSHGGEVKVESARGKGSTFRLFFPEP